jgi:hypothetical protein
VQYRYDPDTNYTAVTMRDDGAGGDAVAGDKVYSATIPGAAAGTLAAFYVKATDLNASAATLTYPNDAPVRECLVRFGENVPGGNMPVYRLWMTKATFDAWTARLKLDNTPNSVTFVLGDQRVMHMTKAQYAGSPYIAPGFNNPAGNRCGYSIEFPTDNPFLGGTDLVLDWPGGHGREYTALQEQMAYWIADRLDLPFSYRHHIRLQVNGVTDMQRGGVFEAVIQPAGEFVNEWSDGDTDGDFFKIDRAFEFSDSGSLTADPMPRLELYQTQDLVNGGIKKKIEKYRWTWLKRSYDTVLNHTNLMLLVDALNAASPEPYTAQTAGLVDIEEFMGIFAFEHIINNFDSWGHAIGKNMYMYKPKDKGWQLYAFDLDWLMLVSVGFGSEYANGGGPLFNSEDPTVTRMYNHPPFRRAYLQTVQAAVDGPLLSANCNPVMDAKYASLVANGVTKCDGQTLVDPTAVKVWFQQRRSYLMAALAEAAASFAVSGPTSFSVSSNTVTLSGTASLAMDTLNVNGVAWPVTWTSVTNWTAQVIVGPGLNTLAVAAYDRNGNVVPGASTVLSVNNTGAMAQPVGQIVINEIQPNPAVPDAEFVELFNQSTNTAFDLSGWILNGLDYTFPAGSYLGPQSYLVLVKDRVAFNSVHGIGIVPFDVFGGNLQLNGETLTLIKPGVTPAANVVVAKVRYEGLAPWPATGISHSSLQLVDAKQDSWRLGNWLAPTNVGTATPGSANSVAASITPFPQLWINELQAENLSGITNSAGQRVPWLELYNPTASAVSLTGLYLSTNYGQLGQWSFPAGAVINPGQFKVVFADGRTSLTTATEWHTSFTLSPGAGRLALTRLSGGSQWQVLDYVTYTNVSPNRSYGSYGDGQSFERQEFYYVTPGAANNHTSQPLFVYINEWMADNDGSVLDPADNDNDDWFEIYNPGDTTVDLGGYFLTDNLTNKFQFEVPDNGRYTIPPHGFLLVWADEETGQNATNRADLHVNFKLGKEGEAIGIFAADGTAVDYVVYGPQTTDWSEGRYPDGGSFRMIVPTVSPRGTNAVPASYAPPTVTDFGYNGFGLPMLSFGTSPGHFYRVEYKDDLGAAIWLPLSADLMATGPELVVVDPAPPAGQRFYRVQQLR